MLRRFFDAEPSSWQDLETMTELAFAEMGYESKRKYSLETVRGTVEIDVYAVKRSSPIPTVVLCECKHWDKPVPQSVVHGFRSVCADAGAHFGLIISKKGFQPGAGNARIATNVHLMNFAEFQETFFEEWRDGISMLMAKMRDQLLPIFRAEAGMYEHGLDIVSTDAISGVNVFNKYSMFFGLDGSFSNYRIEGKQFPDTFNDPRGDPRIISTVTVRSYREYVNVAREALIENKRRFRLPDRYFDDNGVSLIL
jgi:hypothetical protein